jgi:hypothetical protein
MVYIDYLINFSFCGQFKGATTLKKIFFERMFCQIKNIYCQLLTLNMVSNHNIEGFKQFSNYTIYL